MPGRNRSFEKFNYLLRPSKQVERKLFIETLLHLAVAGYDVSDYTYLGFGSVYYVDFVLFHKYLYIDRMICVEHAPIPQRMKFNKPYEFIKLVMKPVAEVIPTLQKKRPYLVWLDYDLSLTPDVLSDIDGFIQRLPAKSLFVVTVDARPRLPDEEVNPLWSPTEQDAHRLEYYQRNFGRYVEGKIRLEQIGDRHCPNLIARIIREKISEALLGRPDLEFIQMFNFLYADDAPMLSIGGLIEKRGEATQIWTKCLQNLTYLTGDEQPVEISVPPLTPRERQWMDSHLPQAQGAGGIPFELEAELIEHYEEYARYYPTYHEAVV